MQIPHRQSGRPWSISFRIEELHKLSAALLHRFVCSFSWINLYQYRYNSIYFIIWVTFHSYFILLLELSQHWLLGAISVSSFLGTFHCCGVLWALPDAPAPPDAQVYLLYPRPSSTISQPARSPGSFFERKVIYWKPSILVATRVLLLPDPLSWQSKGLYMCIPTCVCTHIN